MQAVPFDVTLMALIGPSVPIIPGVRSESMGSAQFAFSGEGTLAYVEGPWAAKGQLAWVDTSGNIDRLPLEAQAYGQLGLAADDRHIAAEITTATTDIFIFDLTRGTRRRLTTEGNNICPVWAPDSKRVAYASDRGGALNLFWESIQGGAAERLCTTTQDQFPLSWSPDGTALAFIEFTHAMNYDLKVVNVDQSCDARPLVATPFDEGTADFSPDGRWIAYTSDESGRMEVYVRRYPPTDEKWDISSEGGADVVWSPTGKDVFYGNGLKRLAAPVEIAPVFAPGKPRLFAEGPFMRHTGHSFDVDRMGRRLLVVTELEQPAHNEIRVVSNWFEELRRKAPSR